MTNLTPELLEKILTPLFQTGGVAPSHGAPADPKKPGVYQVGTNLANKPPQLALHVAKSNRKATVVLSPFAAEDPAKASRMDRYAKRCVQDSLLKNEAPVANHYFYHEVLNSNLSIDRDIGLQSQLTWIKHADLVAVYIDMGITQAMELAINVAKLANRSLEFRKIGNIS